MPLTVAGISPELPPLARELQQIGRGSNVLARVRAPMLSQGDQLHWLCQPDAGVPVDVSIANDTGKISGVTVFLLDVVPPATTCIGLPPAVLGYPRVDLGAWNRTNRQLEEHGQPTAMFTGTTLIVGFLGLDTFSQRINAGCIQFLVGRDAVLAGIVLPRFDAASLRLLETSGVLDAVHLRQPDIVLPEIEIETERVSASTISITAFFTPPH